MTLRTLSFSSFSKPFITDETIIKTATPRDVETKASEEMKERKPDSQEMWKGKKIIQEYYNYYDLPWEKEAYELQEILLKEYKNA